MASASPISGTCVLRKYLFHNLQAGGFSCEFLALRFSSLSLAILVQLLKAVENEELGACGFRLNLPENSVDSSSGVAKVVLFFVSLVASD